MRKILVFFLLSASVVSTALGDNSNGVMVFDSSEPTQRVVQVPMPPPETAPAAPAPMQYVPAPQVQQPQVQQQAVQQAAVQPVSAQPIMVAAPAAPQSVFYAAPPAAAPVAVVYPAPALSYSKSEQLRQRRVEAEKRNEDLLVEKLEEMRSRDEEKRTNQVMGVTAALTGGNAYEGSAPSQSVSAPAVDRPGQNTDKLATTQASATSETAVSEPSSGRFMIIPQGGLSTLNADRNYFDVTPRYSAGVALGVEASQYVSVEAGWLYSEYGIRAASQNPYIMGYNYSRNTYGGTNPQSETLALKQNVFNLGAKVYLLSAAIRIRPFLGAGLGYSRGYVNYDSQVIDYLRKNGMTQLTYDYEVSQFLGQLSAGFDVRASEHLGIGLTGKYSSVFSSRENQGFNNAALYGNNSGNYQYPYAGGYGLYNPDSDKSSIGGSLAKSGFWSVLASLMISF